MFTYYFIPWLAGVQVTHSPRKPCHGLQGTLIWPALLTMENFILEEADSKGKVSRVPF